MTRRFLSLVAAALVTAASVGRADDPPRPPEGSPVVLAPAQSWTAPADGGLCLDKAWWTYNDEVRRYYETRIRVAEDYAEGAGWKGMLLGLSVGLAVGASVALVKR